MTRAFGLKSAFRFFLMMAIVSVCLVLSNDVKANNGGGDEPSTMTAATFKAHGSLIAMLDNFDFEARCGVQSFELYYISKNQDPVSVKNNGAIFSTSTKGIVKRAKAGDIYMFTNVKATCPGDDASRKLNGLTIHIK